MTTNEAVRKVEALADAREAKDDLIAGYESKKAEILRSIQAELEALEAEFAPIIETAGQRVTELEQEVRAMVLKYGASVKGTRLQAVYAKGRTSWDTRGLSNYAVRHPEVLEYQKIGEPTISIRTVKGSKDTSNVNKGDDSTDDVPF
jgi:hypothetical protein